MLPAVTAPDEQNPPPIAVQEPFFVSLPLEVFANILSHISDKGDFRSLSVISSTSRTNRRVVEPFFRTYKYRDANTLWRWLPDFKVIGERYLHYAAMLPARAITTAYRSVWIEECRHSTLRLLNNHWEGVKTLVIDSIPNELLLSDFIPILRRFKDQKLIHPNAHTLVLRPTAADDLLQGGKEVARYLRAFVSPKHICIDLSRMSYDTVVPLISTAYPQAGISDRLAAKIEYLIKDWKVESITWHGVSIDPPSVKTTEATQRFLFKHDFITSSNHNPEQTSAEIAVIVYEYAPKLLRFISTMQSSMTSHHGFHFNGVKGTAISNAIESIVVKDTRVMIDAESGGTNMQETGGAEGEQEVKKADRCKPWTCSATTSCWCCGKF